MPSNALVIAVVAAGVGVGALIDLRTRRIPNALTVTLASTGVACAAVGIGDLSVSASLAGFALGLALMLPGHLIGATGAGDVKLFAAVGIARSQSLLIALLAIVSQGASERRAGDTNMDLITTLRSLVRNDEGQDLLEYALLVALIALVAVAAITLAGQNVNTIFQNIAAAL